MGFSCAICSEALERPPATNPGEVVPLLGNGAAKVSSTPCGHVFHTFCITKWLGGAMATSNSCPCCRKPIPRRTCLPLYPDSYEDSVLEQPESLSQVGVNAESLLRVRQIHEQEIQIKLQEIQKLKSEINSTRQEAQTQTQLYQMQCDEFHKLQTKLTIEEEKSNAYLIKWKKYETYKDAYVTLKEKHDKLEKEVATLNYIKGHIDNSFGYEVEDDVRTFGQHDKIDAIRAISSAKNILQKEIGSISAKRNEDKSNIERLIKQSSKARQQLIQAQQLQHDYNELEAVKDNLIVENNELKRKLKESKTMSPKVPDREVNNNNKSKSPVGISAASSLSSTSSTKPSTSVLNETIVLDGDTESENSLNANDDGQLMLNKRNPFKRPSPTNSNHQSTAEKNKKRNVDKSSRSKTSTSDSSSDDSVLILTPPETSDDDELLSPLEVRIRTNIPGVPPLTPLLPNSKKFARKKAVPSQFSRIKK